MLALTEINAALRLIDRELWIITATHGDRRGGLLATCAELGIQVIAEGIETRAERDALADLGVRLMQGYWFARPSLDAVVAPLAGSWD